MTNWSLYRTHCHRPFIFYKLLHTSEELAVLKLKCQIHLSNLSTSSMPLVELMLFESGNVWIRHKLHLSSKKRGKDVLLLCTADHANEIVMKASRNANEFCYTAQTWLWCSMQAIFSFMELWVPVMVTGLALSLRKMQLTSWKLC